MRTFLKGELLHENKVNVGVNYAKIQKGKLLSKLFDAEDEMIKLAEQLFFRQTRSTSQRHERREKRK